MAITIEEEDTGEEGEDEALVIRRTPNGRGKRKRAENDESAPVENEEPIPLFPNLDKDKGNIVVRIRVFKRDPPGDGFKGDVHPTADLDFIAKRWGNGIFDFHALNAEAKVLRRTENIVISSIKREAPATGLESPITAHERLLDRQSLAAERDADRAYRISSEAITATRTQATTYAEMIRADTEARMQRDREYHATQAAQQAAAFQQMYLQMQQMHQQSMEQQRGSFTQVLQLMSATHERELATSNPMVMLEVLQQGFRMAAETGASDADPLTTAMQTGLGGLRELTKMMALQKGIKSPKLKASNPTAKPKGAPKAEESEAKRVISRAELQEVVALKQVAEAKGYDFEGILEQAKLMVEAAPDQNDESDESDDNDDSAKSGSAAVDSGKPSQ